jgi:predicted RNase H-like nuclease (RuvC/YqgF family)
VESTIIVALLVLTGSIITNIVVLFKSRQETKAQNTAQQAANTTALLQITSDAAISTARSWQEATDRIAAMEKRIEGLVRDKDALKEEVDQLRKQIVELTSERDTLKREIADERHLRIAAETRVLKLEARVKELEHQQGQSLGA